MRPARRWCWVVIWATALAGCSSPTEVDLRFDLQDGWEGTVRTATRSIAVRLDLETTDGVVLRGTGRLDAVDVGVEGRYQPPTVWIRMSAPGGAVEFVGEMLASNLINGTVVSTQEDVTEVGRLTLVRR